MRVKNNFWVRGIITVVMVCGFASQLAVYGQSNQASLVIQVDNLKNEGFTLAQVESAWNGSPTTQASPVNQINPSFKLGICFGGVGAGGGGSDQVPLQPAVLSYMKSIGATKALFWMNGSIHSPAPDAMFSVPRQLAAKGILSTLVLQGNQLWPTPFKVADLPTLARYCNSFPSAVTAGAEAVSFLDEFDNSSQYNDPGNFNSMGTMINVASPIFRAKGYKFIVTSVYFGNETKLWYSSWAKSGVIKQIDFIGWHNFAGSAAAAQSGLDTFRAFATSLGKPVWDTQIQLHMRGGSLANLAAWQAQTTSLFKYARQTPDTVFYFDGEVNSQPAGPAGLFSNGVATPFAGALKSGLSGN